VLLFIYAGQRRDPASRRKSPLGAAEGEDTGKRNSTWNDLAGFGME